MATADPASAPATIAVGPNPTRGAATATFVLTEASQATVTVYDALGRRVARVFTGVAPAGPTRVAVPTGLAPGVYVVRLDTGAGTQGVRVVVTR